MVFPLPTRPSYLIGVYSAVGVGLLLLFATLLYLFCARRYRLNWWERSLLDQHNKSSGSRNSNSSSGGGGGGGGTGAGGDGSRHNGGYGGYYYYGSNSHSGGGGGGGGRSRGGGEGDYTSGRSGSGGGGGGYYYNSVARTTSNQPPPPPPSLLLPQPPPPAAGAATATTTATATGPGGVVGRGGTSVVRICCSSRRRLGSDDSSSSGGGSSNGSDDSGEGDEGEAAPPEEDPDTTTTSTVSSSLLLRNNSNVDNSYNNNGGGGGSSSAGVAVTVSRPPLPVLGSSSVNAASSSLLSDSTTRGNNSEIYSFDHSGGGGGGSSGGDDSSGGGKQFRSVSVPAGPPPPPPPPLSRVSSPGQYDIIAGNNYNSYNNYNNNNNNNNNTSNNSRGSVGGGLGGGGGGGNFFFFQHQQPPSHHHRGSLTTAAEADLDDDDDYPPHRKLSTASDTYRKLSTGSDTYRKLSSASDSYRKLSTGSDTFRKLSTTSDPYSRKHSTGLTDPFFRKHSSASACDTFPAFRVFSASDSTRELLASENSLRRDSRDSYTSYTSLGPNTSTSSTSNSRSSVPYTSYSFAVPSPSSFAIPVSPSSSPPQYRPSSSTSSSSSSQQQPPSSSSLPPPPPSPRDPPPGSFPSALTEPSTGDLSDWLKYLAAKCMAGVAGRGLLGRSATTTSSPSSTSSGGTHHHAASSSVSSATGRGAEWLQSVRKMGSSPSSPVADTSEKFWVPPNVLERKRAQSLVPALSRQGSDDDAVSSGAGTPASIPPLRELSFSFSNEKVPGQQSSCNDGVPSTPPAGYVPRRRASMHDAIDFTKIDARLYDKKLVRQASVKSIEEESLGSIHFSLDHNPETNILTVHIIQARSLVPRDFSGTADPYVRVSLLPDQRSASAQSKTLPYDLVRQASVKSIEEESLGSIHFSLDHNPETNILTVHIIQARSLVPRDFSGTADPYVRVSLLPDQRSASAQSKTHRKTVNPEFDEEFIFELKDARREKAVVQILVYDYDQFSRDECIGVVKTPLRLLDLRERVELWKGILPYEKDSDKDRDVGDVMFSLSYLPSAERLTVVVVKARNLRLPESNKDSPIDPYIKVTVMSGSHKKTKKKKKTATCHSNNNPVWNEALVFNLAKEHLSTIALEVSVLHDNKLGNDERVGKVRLSSDSAGEEKAHWQDLVRESSASARWHKLT